MDRLVRLQAASNYTGLESRSAGERYVVVYLAPGALGTEGAEATLQLNEERKTVPAEFADSILGLLERSGLYEANGLTEWNPELPPTIGFHALACEFESGRIFKTSASGFSEIWAGFAAPFVDLVKAQFGRTVPAPEAEVPEAEAPVIRPIDLGPVADIPAADIPAAEAPAAEGPSAEYVFGDEAEEWAPEYDDLTSEIKSADAELSLVDAELDAAEAKLDLAESRLEDLEEALDAAEAVLEDAKTELDM